MNSSLSQNNTKTFDNICGMLTSLIRRSCKDVEAWSHTTTFLKAVIFPCAINQHNRLQLQQSTTSRVLQVF